MSLPGADELFRATSDEAAPAPPTVVSGEPGDGQPAEAGGHAVRQSPHAITSGAPSGRERHQEKITVYCSGEELLALEQARLTLRGAHGLAVDRGRIVREAVAVVLADLAAKGEGAIIVRRLRGR